MRKLAVAALLLALTATAGCGGSSIPVNSGPLGNGGDNDFLCSPIPRMTPMTNGWTALEYKGDSTVTIEKVTLYKPHDLKLTAAVVLPVGKGTLTGRLATYPPTKADLAESYHTMAWWNARVTADGATLRPGVEYSLALGLLPESRLHATAAGIDVLYRADGQEYLLRNRTTFQVLVGPTCIGVKPPASF